MNTDPDTDKMVQDTDNPEKSKKSNPKSPEGNSSYLQSKSDIENINQ